MSKFRRFAYLSFLLGFMLSGVLWASDSDEEKEKEENPSYKSASTRQVGGIFPNGAKDKEELKKRPGIIEGERDSSDDDTQSSVQTPQDKKYCEGDLTTYALIAEYAYGSEPRAEWERHAEEDLSEKHFYYLCRHEKTNAYKSMSAEKWIKDYLIKSFGAVSFLHDNGTLVVSYRGTQAIGDIITDLSYYTELGKLSHEKFGEALKHVYDYFPENHRPDIKILGVEPLDSALIGLASLVSSRVIQQVEESILGFSSLELYLLSALKFYKKSIQEAQIKRGFFKRIRRIIITGHSLGGLIAELVGGITGDRVITFNSPGGKDLLEKIIKIKKVRPYINLWLPSSYMKFWPLYSEEMLEKRDKKYLEKSEQKFRDRILHIHRAVDIVGGKIGHYLGEQHYTSAKAKSLSFDAFDEKKEGIERTAKNQKDAEENLRKVEVDYKSHDHTYFLECNNDYKERIQQVKKKEENYNTAKSNYEKGSNAGFLAWVKSYAISSDGYKEMKTAKECFDQAEKDANDTLEALRAGYTNNLKKVTEEFRKAKKLHSTCLKDYWKLYVDAIYQQHAISSLREDLLKEENKYETVIKTKGLMVSLENDYKKVIYFFTSFSFVIFILYFFII